MKSSKLLIVLVLLLIYPTFIFSASIQKAEMLNEYGLKRDAKKELINIVFSKTSKTNKAKAYYLLGSMAFDENNISVALNSWKTLTKKYPKSKEAKLVSSRIHELAEIVGESTKESINNAVALSYIRHGDFWSSRKENSFVIDSSWIPNVETAIKWYDKVITEFPKTPASRLAYKYKLRTIMGWKNPGRNGSSHGIKKSFKTYIPMLLVTFESFEKEHPKASSLQGFRYQIAQVFWDNKDWKNTRKWLNIVIKMAGNRDSFYKDTAQRRLKKVEY